MIFFDKLRQRPAVLYLSVSSKVIRNPVALLATGFFIELKTEINFVSISAQQKLKNAG